LGLKEGPFLFPSFFFSPISRMASEGFPFPSSACLWSFSFFSHLGKVVIYICPPPPPFFFFFPDTIGAHLQPKDTTTPSLLPFLRSFFFCPLTIETASVCPLFFFFFSCPAFYGHQPVFFKTRLFFSFRLYTTLKIRFPRTTPFFPRSSLLFPPAPKNLPTLLPFPPPPVEGRDFSLSPPSLSL